jgi:hypothetical protein
MIPISDSYKQFHQQERQLLRLQLAQPPGNVHPKYRMDKSNKQLVTYTVWAVDFECQCANLIYCFFLPNLPKKKKI